MLNLILSHVQLTHRTQVECDTFRVEAREMHLDGALWARRENEVWYPIHKGVACFDGYEVRRAY